MKKKLMLFKIPFFSLAICLLFLISPFSHSLSHALQDDTDEPLLPVGAKFSESSLEEEETLVGFDTIGLRKMGNGRKKVAMKRIVKKEITTTNDEIEEDVESSRISGLYKKSTYKAHQTSQVNHDQETTIDAKGSKNSRYVKEKPASSGRASARDNETQRLLKAAREIANLMHKDYKEWAHRKPPINNREPLH